MKSDTILTPIAKRPHRSAAILPLFTLAAIATLTLANAADETLTPDQLEFFEKKIRPALVEHCYECHSADAEKIKGGLLLDSREGARMGGDSGHAVVPGNLAESLLITAITYSDEDLEMPPKYQLDEDVVADFEQWILIGAPDPRAAGEAALAAAEIDIEKGREFWAYLPPLEPDVPQVKNTDWPASDIDRFILAKLEEKNLSPANDADKRTLIRRIYFDLIGLPPTPAEVEEFVADDDPNAYRKVVDGLLQMDQFGERWGRHWLDVARYAESSGKEANFTFPHAWRYRDYVIDSFNKDKPYDRFLTEQVAGDLLPYKDYAEQADYLVATGFLALGPKSLNENNARQFKADLVDEQIDTMTRSILGTTVACARCHDHKFDPIPTTDYYALAGIFLSTDTYYGTVGTQGNRRASDLLYLSGLEEDELVGRGLTPDEMQRMREQLQNLQKERADLFTVAREARRTGVEPEGFDRRQIQRLNSQLARLQFSLESVDEKTGKPYHFTMGVWEADDKRDANVLIRGELEKVSDPVPRGFVQILSRPGEHQVESREDSGRLELAKWLASPENPLTARVMVNRIWHHLFGKGIVTSVDNFGSTGQPPTHPALLDYLAVRFVENDWSIKSAIREIVLSRTYRMSSDYDEAAYAVDPDNTWHWRMSKRRLDAEAIRDAMLDISGTLDYDRPKGSLVAFAGDGFVGRAINEQTLARQDNYRSVYLPIVRDLLPDSLELFDFAEPSLVTGSRDQTNVPSQALYLMNNPFVIGQSEVLARRLTADGARGPELLAKAFNLAFSRPPTLEEMRKTKAFFDRFVATAAEEGYSTNEANYLALTTYCQSLFAGAEFRYLN